MLLDRRKEVSEGRGVGLKSGAAGKDAKRDGVNARAGMTRAGRGLVDSGLFEVYEAPADEGTDALAYMLREDAARIIVVCHTYMHRFLCKDCAETFTIAFCYLISVHCFHHLGYIQILYMEYVTYLSVCACEAGLKGADGSVQRIRTQREHRENRNRQLCTSLP